ncbi:NUDIX hydrolase [Aggregicoccus sp. 17bor-14]|uniref:NUDIX hydrolase n=1 Tax=Myxococcaceae TaxID=31 RepID=UPI0012F3135D|nr:NUDIX hydrolase [Simulacricoccus sp. 17bor-14]MRI88603.1 NUDIX hydrolase [Aggregicoccus sp. 17bor-14]
MTPKPWPLLRRGRTYDFKILQVREDVVADPRTGNEHPRVTLECADWVNVIAYTKGGELVLIRQFRNGIRANTLEVPGGIIEPGEDPALAAARELEEETGYRPARVEPLGWVHPNPAMQTNRTYSFVARDCEKVHAGAQDAGEDIAVELHRREDVARLILENEITHSLVVVAFYLEEARSGR